MGHAQIGAGQNRLLGHEGPDPVGRDAAGLGLGQAAGMGHQHLRARTAAGPRDPRQQPRAMPLQRSQRGIDEGPRRIGPDVGGKLLRHLALPERAKLDDMPAVHRAGIVEARRDLRQGQAGREAILQPRQIAQAPMTRPAPDHAVLGRHQQAGDPFAPGIALQPLRRGVVRPAQEGQGYARLGLHGHGAGDRNQRQAQGAGQQARGRLHLVAQDQVRGQAAQQRRGVAAQPVGAAGARQDLGQQGAGLGAQGGAGQGGLAHGTLQHDAGFGQKDRLVPPAGPFPGQRLEGAQVAVQGRADQDGAHGSSGWA